MDVLLPLYGDPGLLRRAVGSVLGQTPQAWHVVVVDDACPDGATAGLTAAVLPALHRSPGLLTRSAHVPLARTTPQEEVLR